jgi:uncharacterized BrkB/YihY/UPF0761 family membrane protein
MNRKRFVFYWAVILVLAAIVLIVLLIAGSGSTQALDSFPIKTLHGGFAPVSLAIPKFSRS